jgi:NitT/TauT family transport system substrate-binding protein
MRTQADHSSAERLLQALSVTAQSAPAQPAPASAQPYAVPASRRAALTALGAGALAATLSIPRFARAQPARAPLRIGVWATGIQLALTELITERKLFEKYGLNYELVRFADVNGSTVGLATGRIDAAFSASAVGALDLVSRKRPLKIILVTQAADGRLVTNKANIRDVAGLRGHIVGMAPAGSAGAAYTQAFLAKNYGLPENAYRNVGGGEARLLQLLIKGDIDAALLREVSFVQFGQRLELRPLADQRREWARLAGPGAIPPLGLGIIQQQILDSRRDQAVAFVAALVDAIRLGAAEPDFVTRLIARTQQLSPVEARAYASTWALSFHGKFEDADLASLDVAQQLFVASGALGTAAQRSCFDQTVYRDALGRVRQS